MILLLLHFLSLLELPSEGESSKKASLKNDYWIFQVFKIKQVRDMVIVPGPGEKKGEQKLRKVFMHSMRSLKSNFFQSVIGFPPWWLRPAMQETQV